MPCTKEKIPIVDDESSIRMLISHALAQIAPRTPKEVKRVSQPQFHYS
jgi:hypothetical protein